MDYQLSMEYKLEVISGLPAFYGVQYSIHVFTDISSNLTACRNVLQNQPRVKHLLFLT